MTTVNVPRCSIEHILHAKWSVNSCRSQQPPNSRYFNRIFFHLKEKKWRGYGQGSHEWGHLLCHQNVRNFHVQVHIYHPLHVCSSSNGGLGTRLLSFCHSAVCRRARLPTTQYMYDAQTCNATHHQVYMSFMPKDPLPLLTSLVSI